MADEARSNQRASPAQVAQALGGVQFPKTKQELIDHARRSAEKQGNPDVIAVLERMADREYGSMADVEKGVGQTE